MIQTRHLNSLVEQLTGVCNFVTHSTVGRRNSILAGKSLHIGCDDAFHEFCHFLEASNAVMSKPNFGLTVGGYDSYIRELYTAKIEYILANEIAETKSLYGETCGYYMPRVAKQLGNWDFTVLVNNSSINPLDKPSVIDYANMHYNAESVLQRLIKRVSGV